MESFQDLKSAPLETVAPGIRRFIFTLDHVMCVYFEIEPGVVVSEHAHPHEQLGMLLEGKTKFRIGEEETIIEGPTFYRIPSQVPHQAEVVGDKPARILDAFSPIREDFLTGEAPHYMKNGASR